MKILQTARWFFPHVGGASVRVYHTARNLIEFGHEVHLLVHNPKSIEQCNLQQEAPPYENYEGIHVYRLPHFKPNSLYWAATIPLMAKKAVDIIRKEKIDVILSHNPPYLVGMSSWIASKITKKPLILNVHDVWGASHYSTLQYKIGAELERFCIRRASKIIVPCKGIDEILIKRTNTKKEKFAIALTAVDFNLFKPLPEEEKTKTKKSLGIKEKEKTILFLGTLAPWKGADYLIKAIPEVLEKHPDTKIVFVGHGVSYNELKKKAEESKISENMLFLGAVNYFNLPPIINCADVCVSSFPKPETVGRETTARSISVLEFMSCGKPVILPKNPGFDEFIKDGINGVFFEPENTRDLADKIIELLNNKGARVEIGNNARKTIIESCSWKESIKVIEKAIIEELK